MASATISLESDSMKLEKEAFAKRAIMGNATNVTTTPNKSKTTSNLTALVNLAKRTLVASKDAWYGADRISLIFAQIGYQLFSNRFSVASFVVTGRFESELAQDLNLLF
jgi:hypothetical protein